MTIASEIQRIKTNIENAYDALGNLGATMPATEDTDHLVSTIQTVSTGDEISAKNVSGAAVSNGDKVWIEQVSEAPSATITAVSGNLLGAQSYDLTIMDIGGYGFVNGHTNGGSYTYSVSNDLTTATQGSTAISYNPSGYFSVLGDKIYMGNYYSGHPQWMTGNGAFEDLPNYPAGWHVGSSNGEKGAYYYTNSGVLRLFNLDGSSYNDYSVTINNTSNPYVCYDKNTGKVFNFSNIITISGSSASLVSPYYASGNSSYIQTAQLTSDGKYIISQQFYDSDPQYNTNYVLRVYSISGNTYTRVEDSVFGSWLTTGCDVFYNPNCDVLTCCNRSNGDYGFFKYDPSTEIWSAITVDLSSITTPSNFQCPIYVNNQNNQLLFKVGNSGGDYRTNGGKIYMANYTISGGGLVWKIESFSEVTSDFLSGVAQENIAIDATGTVKTILPQ